MKNLLSKIFILLFCFQIGNGFAKDIVVDASFSSSEIYNSLVDNSEINNTIELTINLENKLNSPQQLYVSFINPTLDKINIKEDSTEVILGDLIRFTKRKFKHNNHVYPISLDENQSKTITIIVLKQWQANNFRINISTENTFIKTTNHDNFFLGIFFGILFMFLLLLACFYIFSKSNFFIIYLGINIFMLLLIFYYTGIGYQFFWFFSATIQKYIVFFCAIGYFTLHIYFIRTFFIIRFKNNYTSFILKISFGMLALFGIVALFQLYNRSYNYSFSNIYYYIINSLLIVYALMVISLCLYTYYESKRREIVWILIGFLLHFFNWIIIFNNEYAMFKPLNILDNFKLFSSNLFLPQINLFITSLELFIITIFISINYHNLIKQNNLSVLRLEFMQNRNINKYVLGQEDEREKISKQISTSISNDIVQLKLLLSKLKQNDEKKIIPNVIQDIDKTLADIQNITSNYVAPNMQQMKLEELISTASEKIFTQTNLSYDFSRIPDNYQLNSIANINLYRIIQEISNNIIKHSKAVNVTISAIKDSKSLQIKITDDGVGFHEFEHKNKGIGLMNIESRMNSLNGNFHVLSNVEKGCTMHLIMPLKDVS